MEFEIIPVPDAIIVPLTIALVATVIFLLKDVNKGKGPGTQIWNIVQGSFGVLLTLWLVLNVLLNLTGASWGRLLNNHYMVAFLETIGINPSELPEWLNVVVAVGLFYLAIKFAAGSGATVWAKVWNILKYYGVFLLLMGFGTGLLFSLVDKTSESFLSSRYVQSLLREFGLIP